MSEKSSIPHIRLPRSLLQDPLWVDLPLAYQNVFTVLVSKVCFKPQRFDDHGVIIDLLPGQICISERELLKFCNKYVTRNDIQRSIKKFILYEFVSQEVRHKKSVLTIKHSDTYELIIRSSEPRSEPNLSQTRAKLEPEKKNEENVENEEDIISREALNQKKVVGFDFSIDQGLISQSKGDQFSEGMSDNARYFVNTKEFKEKQKIICQHEKEEKKGFGEDTVKLTQNKKTKKQTTSDENKKSFGSFVRFSEEEYSKFFQEHGKEKTHDIIDSINDHCANNRRGGYLDYAAAFRTFLRNYKPKKQTINSLEAENRSLAQEISKCYVSIYYTIEILPKAIEFIPRSGQAIPDSLEYSAHGFRDQLKNILIRKKFQETK